MPYNADDRRSLWSWINNKGVPEFWESLAAMAEDRIDTLSKIEGPDRHEKMALAQWTRMHRKLQELAAWRAEFGPGSGCR